MSAKQKSATFLMKQQKLIFPTGNYLNSVSLVATEESRKVSERVRAGQHISRTKNILYGCGNILGYELKRNIDENGKWDPAENTYIINPEQAETVKMIYDLYEEGNGITKIRTKRHSVLSAIIRYDSEKLLHDLAVQQMSTLNKLELNNLPETEQKNDTQLIPVCY